jgi:hypothetical protein
MVKIQYIGPFFIDWTKVGNNSTLTQRGITLLGTMVHFFTKHRLKNYVVPITTQCKEKSVISLRLLDWFVTNYSRSKIHINGYFDHDIHSIYVLWLNEYRRALFDAYKRGTRIYFKCGGKIYETTIGQLNFLKWVKDYGVYDYVINHRSQIEKDLQKNNKKNKRLKKKNKKKEKRKKYIKPSSHVRIFTDEDKNINSNISLDDFVSLSDCESNSGSESNSNKK